MALPRSSGYESVLSRRRFVRSTRTWTVSNIPRLTKTLHQSYDLTGHMIIWGGLFAHGDGSTGLMKVVFCYALPTVAQAFGTNETLHFRTTTCWAQLLL
jgi:hypothetical protein